MPGKVVDERAITGDEIHPTVNYVLPDCDLNYVPKDPRKQRVDTMVPSSFGFGGQNACLVFKKWDSG